jgi:hypothetical protein
VPIGSRLGCSPRYCRSLSSPGKQAPTCFTSIPSTPSSLASPRIGVSQEGAGTVSNVPDLSCSPLWHSLLFSPTAPSYSPLPPPPPPPAATLVPRPMPLPQSASFSLAPNPARLCRPAPCPFFPFHPSVLLLCRPRQHTAGEDTSGIRSALTNRGAQHGLMLHHWTVPEVTWD